MPNFNPDHHDNAINPYRLSEAEQLKILKAIDDQRLMNPPGDYFFLELDNKTIDVPKLEYISKKTSDGRITRLPTLDYIRQILDLS